MIQVLQSGIQTSIQDLGRWGSQSFGIGVGGSMCRYSTAIVNLLVGNSIDAPVLELVQSPHNFLFGKETIISFSGGGMIPTANGVELALNRPHCIEAGTLVKIKKPIAGFRLYMAVAGGFEASEFLGSYATHFATNSGGFEGRIIQKGDVLNFNEVTSPISDNIKKNLKKKGYFKINGIAFAMPQSNEIRVIKGVNFDLLNEESQKAFSINSFIISNNSNRMGYRLNGIPLWQKQPTEMISSAVTMGTIQLLPDGHLITLMPDCQTVGGYPKIAHIIEADFIKCAQIKPGDSISFSIISMLEAEKLLERQSNKIQLLQNLIIQNFS